MSTSLKIKHANEIAEAMASLLNDEEYKAIHRTAGFKVEAAGAHEQAIEQGIASGDPAQCQKLYNAYFGGGDADSALQAELQMAYGAQAMAKSADLRDRLRKCFDKGPGSSLPPMMADDSGLQAFLAQLPTAQDPASLYDEWVRSGKLSEAEQSAASRAVAEELGKRAAGGQMADDVGPEGAADGSAVQDAADMCAHDGDKCPEGCDCGCQECGDGMMMADDPAVAMALSFAISHLVKVADALDNHGFAGIASTVDETIQKLAAKKKKKDDDDEKEDKKDKKGKKGKLPPWLDKDKDGKKDKKEKKDTKKK